MEFKELEGNPTPFLCTIIWKSDPIYFQWWKAHHMEGMELYLALLCVL